MGTAVANWADLADGAAIFWTQGEAKATFRLIVLRSGDAVFGYVNRCAHFGVPLADKIEQLIFTPHETLTCNVHYARYRWQDGTCQRGDCDGEALLRVPLELANGKIVVSGI